MIKLAMLFGILILVGGCTDAEHAKGLLESQGFTNVQAGGYDFWGCSEDDEVSTKFTAISPTGTTVSGTVCKGFFMKNATIRWN